MSARWIVAGFAAGLLASAPLLRAQRVPRPLSPMPAEEGNRVAPFFDGWYANPDGSISLSFGYSNMNRSTVEIPLGPDNFITPKEYDGRQPTSFPVALAGRQGGGANVGVSTTPPASGGSTPPSGAAGGAGGGRGGPDGGGTRAQYERERGVFTVTVPGDFKGDVVWTLRYQGQTWSIPGRSRSTAYQLSWPMAMGSVPPLLRFQPDGPAGRGPMGVQGPALQARANTPVALSVWLTDDAAHEKEPIPVKRDIVPSMNVTWYKHAGPAGAPVVFNPAKSPIAETKGMATTTATFREPGDYVVRVRGDSFGNIDSTADDQCCWTNGYVRVTVTQ